MDFFRCHLNDAHKTHNTSRFWPDWYKIKWVDRANKTLFDYGQALLVRPDRKHDIKKCCRFSDTILLNSSDTMLAGSFNFRLKVHGISENKLVDMLHWISLAHSYS